MTYAALPDRRMPWDDDGTICGMGNLFDGITVYPSGSQNIQANGSAFGSVGAAGTENNSSGAGSADAGVWLFFPEQREVTAYYAVAEKNAGSGAVVTVKSIQGSNDTTNGLDGTWETATISGSPTRATAYSWRDQIKTISFTGPKQTIRILYDMGSATVLNPYLTHVYGAKGSGQTPDDILFLDPTASDAEFVAPIDFADQPLGTTVVKTFKVKNGSATKTANTINIQCNDADMAISDDNVTFTTTLNISSLGAGAKSGTLYIRCTTPAAGNLMGPRFARIVVTVASFT